MPTKRELELAIAAYGLGRVLPAGSTRRAARAAVSTIVKGGRVVVPPVARAVGRTALANPVLATSGLALGAYQAGLLDPAIARAQEESFRAQENLRRLAMESDIQQAYERAGRPTFGEAAEELIVKPARRKVSKYAKAVSASMKAVKASKFGGKPGRISNAKSVFSTVNKVASAVNKGKKVAKTGIRGVAARAARRFLK